ncbi:hypothetical protein NDU88_003658, partial [Pleurodeles waltl]
RAKTGLCVPSILRRNLQGLDLELASCCLKSQEQQRLLSASTWSLWRDSYSALWCPSSSWDPERRSW